MTYEFKTQDPKDLTTIEKIENLMTNYFEHFNYGSLYFEFKRVDANKTIFVRKMPMNDQIIKDVLDAIVEHLKKVTIYPHNNGTVELRGY